MKPTKLRLDYRGPDRLFRGQVHLRSNLAWWLDTPARYQQEIFGSAGADELRAISEVLRARLDTVDEPDWPDIERLSDVLRTTKTATINAAREIVQQKTDDPEIPQDRDQTRRFRDRLDWFADRFEAGQKCGCDVCAKDIDYQAVPLSSFRNDDTPPVPTCLRRFSRIVELARIFVEALYDELLPHGVIHGEVSFALPQKSQTTVNGTTRGVRIRPPRGTDGDLPVVRKTSMVLSLPLHMGVINSHALLYVAAHELGIHAVQQIGLSKAPTKDNTDEIFCEGMVEAALYGALERTLTNESARYLNLRAFQDACLERHGLHILPGQRASANAGDISLGQAAYRRLVRFADAGVHTGIIKTDPFDTKVRVLLQLAHICDGESWACRLVLAMNLIPFDKPTQSRLFSWLDARVGTVFVPPQKWFAELAELRACKEDTLDLPLVRFLHLLRQVMRNPHNSRVQSRLLKAIETA